MTAITSTTATGAIVRPDWFSPDVWPYEIKHLDTVDGPVHFTDVGSGAATLLVHAGFSSFVWRSLIAELESDHRVVTLDFPGHGLTPRLDRDVSVAAHADILDELVTRLDLVDITLVAHDLGGHVAIGAARRWPERVESLAFVNTFAWPPEGRALRTMLRLMGSRTMRALDAATAVVPRLSKTSFGVGRHLDRDARRAFLRAYTEDRDRIRAFHDLMRTLRDHEPFLEANEAALGSVFGDRPAVTVFGERNDPFGLQARFGRYFATPPAEYAVARGNHFPMCDDSSLVATAIRSLHRVRH